MTTNKQKETRKIRLSTFCNFNKFVPTLQGILGDLNMWLKIISATTNNIQSITTFGLQKL